MKRKVLLLCTFMMLSLCGFAQDSVAVVNTRAIRFAYVSYSQALQSVPGYNLAQQSLSNLRAKYEAELKRAEDEFNLKYEEFLEGQRDFPETILRKRQTELKELLERNLAFKNEIREQLSTEETKLMAPLKQYLDSVLAQIGFERGYAFILNTDANAVSFIHPALGVDINELVRQTIINQTTIKSVVH